jgi:hypothetical protein
LNENKDKIEFKEKNMEDWRVIGPIIGAFTVIYGWLFKHASNSDKHPSKDAIVYKDACVKTHDCVEAKLDGMKELMEQRFDSVEYLIKNGGK